ncbi:hypothetical protein [Streptomyces sp. Wh19]|nr:hypothetical protein [Streptomyces sp. Wh19]MDV9195846.1 hypothetical protein [Streptomyces sp. Wh19]
MHEAGEQVSGDKVFGARDAKIGKIDGQERYAYHGFGVLAAADQEVSE